METGARTCTLCCSCTSNSVPSCSSTSGCCVRCRCQQAWAVGCCVRTTASRSRSNPPLQAARCACRCGVGLLWAGPSKSHAPPLALQRHAPAVHLVVVCALPPAPVSLLALPLSTRGWRQLEQRQVEGCSSWRRSTCARV